MEQFSSVIYFYSYRCEGVAYFIVLSEPEKKSCVITLCVYFTCIKIYNMQFVVVATVLSELNVALSIFNVNRNYASKCSERLALLHK